MLSLNLGVSLKRIYEQKKFPAWIVQYKLNTQLHVAGRFWFTKSKVIHKLFKKHSFYPRTKKIETYKHHDLQRQKKTYTVTTYLEELGKLFSCSSKKSLGKERDDVDTEEKIFILRENSQA